MLTKNGIEFELPKSNYFVNYKGLTYYFSSKIYKDKFINNVDKYIEEETYKISAKYNLQIDLSIYLAISFYQKIEKRGFYILKSPNEEISKNFIVVME